MRTPSVEWARRDEPLAPAGVLGLDKVTPALAAACAAMCQSGPELRAAGASSSLLIMGPAESLPWADGAIYLGWDSGLLMPTTRRSTAHPDLLGQALLQKYGSRRFVVVPGRVIAYELSDGPVDVAWLHHFAGAASR